MQLSRLDDGGISERSGKAAVEISVPVAFAGDLLPAEGSGSRMPLGAPMEEEQL